MEKVKRFRLVLGINNKRGVIKGSFARKNRVLDVVLNTVHLPDVKGRIIGWIDDSWDYTFHFTNGEVA